MTLCTIYQSIYRNIIIIADLPTEHSVYIELALETILEPVVDGVSKLKLSSQLNAMSMAVSAVCEAWKNFILKEKIKFR